MIAAGIVHAADTLPEDSSPPDEPLRLELEEVMLLAADRNASVRQAIERIREAEGAVTVERSDLLPRLDARVSQKRQQRSTASFGLPEQTIASVPDPVPFSINYPGLSPNLIRRFNLPTEGFTQITEEFLIDYDNALSTGPFNFFDASLQFSMTLFDRSQYDELSAARTTLNRREMEVDYVREEAATTAAQLFKTVLVHQRLIDAIQGKIDLQKDKLQEVRDLQTVGVARVLDVKKEELALAGSENSLAEAVKKHANSLRELKRYLDLPPGQELELLGDLLYYPAAEENLETAEAEAMERRLDLKLQILREQIAQEQLAATRNKGWPDFTASGTYGRQGDLPDDTIEAWSVGIAASFPIWDGYDRRGKTEIKASQLQQTRYDTEDLVAAIRNELALIHDERTFTAATVDLMEQSVQYLEENRQYLEDKVTAGVGKRIDLLSAEVELAQAEYKWIEAIYNHEIARILWLKAIGAVETIADTP
jgi:outer membrane protein TolC